MKKFKFLFKVKFIVVIERISTVSTDIRSGYSSIQEFRDMYKKLRVMLPLK